jgi:hypothetical protein
VTGPGESLKKGHGETQMNPDHPYYFFAILCVLRVFAVPVAVAVQANNSHR